MDKFPISLNGKKYKVVWEYAPDNREDMIILYEDTGRKFMRFKKVNWYYLDELYRYMQSMDIDRSVGSRIAEVVTLIKLHEDEEFWSDLVKEEKKNTDRLEEWDGVLDGEYHQII